MSLLAGALHVNLTGNNQSLDSALDKSIGKVKDFGDTTKNTQKDAKNHFEGIGKVAGTALLGMGTLFAGIGAASIKSASEMQNMGVSLKTAMGGSQEATDAARKTIIEFTAKTPYALGEVQNGFVKLKNMGLDPGMESLTAYGDTASAMGKSLNDMVEAVADAATGEFERLKEFGIRSQSEGDRVKFTFKGVTTEVAKNSEEIQKYLKDLGKTNFGGGMEAQAKTLTGTWSTFSDTIQLKLGEIALKSGALDVLTGAMNLVGGAIDKVKVEDIAKGFGDFGNWIKENEQTLTVLSIGLGTITVALTAQSAGTAITTGLMGGYTFATGLATGATTALSGAIAVLTSPIGLAILAIGAIIAVGYLLVANWDTIKKVAGEVWSNITSELSKAGDSIKNTFSGIMKSVNSKIEEMKASVMRNVQGIQQVFQGFVEIVSGLLTGDFDKVIEGAKNVVLGLGKIDLFQIGVDMIQGLINGVGSMAGALWSKMTEMASGAINALKGAMGIQSPSIVFKGFGINTVEGYNLGIDAQLPSLKDKMKLMASYTMQPLQSGNYNNSKSNFNNPVDSRTYNNTYNYPTPQKEYTVFESLNLSFN